MSSVARTAATAASPTTYGPPRLQAVFTRMSDQSAPTYPVSRTKLGRDGDSVRPGPHNSFGVERHVSDQGSRSPFYCQAISLPPPANIVLDRRLSRFLGYRLRRRLLRFKAAPGAQNRPNDPCQLVRKCHDDNVYMCSRSQAAQPFAECGIGCRQRRHSGTCAVDRQLAQVYVATLPRLVIPFRRGLPTVVCCRGTRPSQAARSRPRAKLCPLPMAAQEQSR